MAGPARRRWRRVVLGLGSSLGSSAETLELAVRALDAEPGIRVLRASRLYRTAPTGGAVRPFLNAAVLVETTHPPRGLLVLCKALEVRLGRRPSRRWADRALDIDVLLYEGIRRQGRGLALPHRRLLERDFALEPAREVAAGLVVPGTGRTLGDQPPAPLRTGLHPVGLLPAPSPLAAVRSVHYTALPAPPARPRTAMKIFLDTANLDHIREAASWGVIDGVTTNPSLIAKEGGDFVDTIAKICDIVEGPVSAETVATGWEGMVKEGRLLAQISEHVVVKIPMTRDGIRATRVLADDGIDVNVTLCFQAAQALLAAKAGAAYISPFMGRLDDIALEGLQLIEQIGQMYANYPELGTEVLAASIRHPLHVAQVAAVGADVATIPFSTLVKLTDHPLTDIGLEKFLADWATVPDNDVAGQVERWLARRDRA